VNRKSAVLNSEVLIDGSSKKTQANSHTSPKKMGEIGEIVPERHSIAIGSKKRDTDDPQLHRGAIGSRIEVWMTEQLHGGW
jgi:hypothetical protein